MTLLPDRRQFTRQALGLAALTATVPTFLHKTGRALAGDARTGVAPLPGLKDNHVLVIVQLAGGNDGLNTVIPFSDDAYYRSRPTIGIDAKKVLKLDDRLGLHPEMVELHKAYQDGGLAVVTNVGYPNPNRSHFRATDIWETASPADRIWKTGWVGRYFDNDCTGTPGAMLGLRLGEQAALTFGAKQGRAATLANPSMLEVPAKGAAVQAMEQLSKVEFDRNCRPGLRPADRQRNSHPFTPNQCGRPRRQAGRRLPSVRVVPVAATDRPDDRGGDSHQDLLRDARRLRHPWPPKQPASRLVAGTQPGSRRFSPGLAQTRSMGSGHADDVL